MDLFDLAVQRAINGSSGGGGGGSDEEMIVHVTDNNGDWVTDKNYEEIAAAIAANKVVTLVQYSSGTPLMIFHYANKLGTGTSTKFLFYSIYIGNTSPTQCQLYCAVIDPNGAWSIFSTFSKTIKFG